MTEANRKKLARGKANDRFLLDELAEGLMPQDRDVKQYKELREKYKGKKMKTNLDLIE